MFSHYFNDDGKLVCYQMNPDGKSEKVKLHLPKGTLLFIEYDKKKLSKSVPIQVVDSSNCVLINLLLINFRSKVIAKAENARIVKHHSELDDLKREYTFKWQYVFSSIIPNLSNFH
ncbi:hypothetical protein IPJ91_01000 [bacterium]|nr:MAG: hypothetical protein IPJ91_01000 [bacterium]